MSTKKTAVKLEYNGKEYIGDFADATDDGIKAVCKAIEQAISGKLGYVTFDINGAKAFFPTEVLQRSVITLIHKEEN